MADHRPTGRATSASQRGEPDPGLAHRASPPASAAIATILIADDSPTVRIDLAKALDSAGFHALPCETIAEARIALRSQPIAVAILDVQLPDGDGVDLLAQIRKVRDQLLRSELDAAEVRAAKSLAEARAAMAEELARANDELAQANRELEAFSYSVSHDLRAPLRTISAFTYAIIEDSGDHIDDRARDHIRRVLAATARMSDLIDALLELSRISRAPLGRHRVDLGQLAGIVIDELARRDPAREVGLDIAPGLLVDADGRLMRILLDNLLGNAWKYTTHVDPARIEIGREPVVDDGDTVFYVRDNGAGFDSSQADRLFTPFQRLHNDSDFTGTGIGLATVRRIVERHGGKIWAEGSIGTGAKISFTVPSNR